MHSTTYGIAKQNNEIRTLIHTKSDYLFSDLEQLYEYNVDRHIEARLR